MLLEAHFGALPLEETLLPLATGVGTGLLLLTRAWLARWRRHRDPAALAPNPPQGL